ncbi:hypothetical protein [Rubricoccus marinus]|uniref:Outer membrane protein beta-barrel domain-containing protein n=1 Tax=Rubricoccus marinus TaxID=716817 RepID=A0A259TZ28_9BACT|nr:hypothetical protein [Rubricoccus marinus]OZC03012.1 hypothetical protein BSZ36_08540 [Rubricoccus marinus]
MRTAVLTTALGLALLVAAPASAQLQANVPGRQAPVEVIASPEAPTLSLAGLFNAQTLKLSQSYQYGYQTGAYGDLGLGTYTTSLQWQPSNRLAARVDVGLAHGAVGSLANAAGFSADNPAKIYLQNAELAYRPTENSMIRLQVRQTPYGSACTYGYQGGCSQGYGMYGQGFGLNASSGASGNLFFRDAADQ